MTDLNQDRVYIFFNDHLVNRIFKILPLYEEENETLGSYIESLVLEIMGLDTILDVDDGYFISLVATLKGIQREILEKDNKSIIKRETFKCIDLSKNIASCLK